MEKRQWEEKAEETKQKIKQQERGEREIIDLPKPLFWLFCDRYSLNAYSVVFPSQPPKKLGLQVCTTSLAL